MKPGETDWTLTGRMHWQLGWFGRAVLTVEEARRAFRPVCDGHTPANWQQETRWRKALFRDLWDLEVQPEVTIMPPSNLADRMPMPPGTKAPPG